MRVLLLTDRIPPENRGGAGEIVWRLALGLRDSGHDVHVGVATDKDAFTEKREGIATYHLHSRYPERWRAYLSLYNPQTSGALRELYQRVQPDVVNAHNIHADLSYYSLTLAHRMGIPTVFSSHDVMPFAYTKLSHFINPDSCDVAPSDYTLPTFYNFRHFRLRYNPLRNRVIRHILTHHTRARTAVSDELAHAHHANSLPPFQTVHNGIDVQRFSATAETIKVLRDRLGLQGRNVILFGGRLTAAKGTLQLLLALQQVVASVPKTLLLVLSPQPITAQIQDEAFADLVHNHIVSGGWLSGEDLASAYHLADAVVVPSIIFDSFPTMILEAMACGKPVIATCFGGSKEAVVNGETGYILNPYQTETFADVLSALLLADEFRAKMGANAYQRVTADFSLQKQVDEMVTIYENVQL